MLDDNGFDHALGDRVRTALRAEVGDVTAPPTLLADLRRQHTRRRVARRITFFATPVVAAAIAVAGVLTVSDLGTSPSTSPGTSPMAAAPVNAAYVKEQTTKALDKEAHDVLYERGTDTSGGKYGKPGQRTVYERWYSADRSAFRVRVTVDGTVVEDESHGPDGGVYVDFRNRTWRATSPSLQGGQILAEEVMTPGEIQQHLADGSLKVVGPGGTVNGRPTILLHRDPGKAEVPVDLWVDETSYLPVQFRYQQDDSFPFAMTLLPPTNDNLALLRTVAPQGFHQQ
ncbi:hypothetical protein ORV05_22930 [Amycolatopsis cynarae]|uniref:MucB/RseB N-terminal domain-containing protein n=1 Tax=Amycolatopsis cynarae TaxID=2995223 RepID=A0ABY7AV24_9PSEU|nr:hypothetical protein [Amycolatopsis sp. HUAS 11-8]WAL63835.1 hypothetical protein ORV05_22930 [Amycolatopsis sp. HUAS 11-8]